MKKIKLNLYPEVGEVLSKNELKHIFGGIGSETASGSNDGKVLCTTTCRHNAQGVLSISLLCEGSCQAINETSVTCSDTQATKYCPPYDKTVGT
ncbi:MAG: hypothetical protein WCR36_05125 [Bacteroidaceae bacterium]